MSSESYSRKSVTTLDQLEDEGSDLLFVDERNDTLVVSGVRISLSVFKRIGGRGWQVSDSRLTQCVFDDCYFRNAKFTKVDFTGSTFVNCNLEQAEFHDCTFDYVRFRRTGLDGREVLDSFPGQPNRRRILARELRVNSLETGRKKDADMFWAEEIRADRDHHWRKFTRPSGYYRDKYDLSDQLGAGWRFGCLWLGEIAWGHGRYIGRLLTSLVALTLMFTVIIWESGMVWHVSSDQPARALSFEESAYVALTGLVGGALGDAGPSGAGSRWLGAVELLVGFVFLGLFVAAVYRRISR